MRRVLMLLAGGAFLSLTAATQPAAPPSTAEEAAATSEVVTATAPVASDAGVDHLLIAGEPAAPAENELSAEASTGLEQPIPDTPYAHELSAARQQFKQRLAELTAAFRQEKDPTRSMALQREIQQLKLDTEIGTLEIQARHARLAGKTELADEADALVQRMRQAQGAAAPVSTLQPSDAAAGAQH